MKAFIKKNTLPLIIFALGSIHIALQKGEYVTTAVLKLDSVEDTQTVTSPLLPMPNDENALLEDIISSKHYLGKLNNTFKFDEHLKSIAIPYRNYRAFSNNDELFDVMRNYVTASYNEDKGITTLSISAYDPDNSFAMATGAITLLKEVIANQNIDKTESQLEPTRIQIAEQEKNVRIAQAALQGFEQANNLSNPEPILEGHVISLAEVQKQIHSKEVEIEKLLTYLHPAEHEVIIAKQELSALHKSANLIGAAALNDSRVKKLMMEHENLMIDLNTAREGLTQLKIKFQSLQQDLLKKHKHITVISVPVKPTQTEKPDRLKNFFVLIITVLFFRAVESTLKRRKG